jgi:two-component system, LytTR family, response regulator
VVSIALHHQKAHGRRSPEEHRAMARGVLQRDDFVLLTDDLNSWIVRVGDVSTFEARRCETLIRFGASQVLIRRTLEHCEARLDNSLFFRASRGCIVNLSHLSRPRLKDGCLSFLVNDGREIVFSRRQMTLFRATRGL